MKKRLIMISALVLAVVLALFALTACNSANSAVGEELVSNGDFSNWIEDDPAYGTDVKMFADWSTSTSSVTFGKGTPSNDSTDYYLYIDNGSSAKYTYLYQQINVNAGKIYKVSVDMRINSALSSKSGAYVMFLENTSKDNWFASHRDVTNGFVNTTFYIRPQNTDVLTLALCLGNDETGSSGRVCFDNVSVQRVDKNAVPDGETIHNIRRTSKVMANSTVSGICYVVLLTVFTAIVFAGLYIVIRRMYSKRDVFVSFDESYTPAKKGAKAKSAPWYTNAIFIAALLAIGTFLIRLVLLLTTYGMGTTMNNVVNNAVALGVKDGVFNFFSKYPKATLAPGEMYILAVIGAIFGEGHNAEISILVRFVNVLADMAVVLMIYFYGKKYVGNKLSTVYASLYAGLPLVFTMSGFNGTCESLLVALMLGAVILIVEKKYLPTYFMLTLAAVLDIRALAIAPIAVAY
ncbi:MAG: glycosyltransferase family 39 protein, partial [Clostridia bacterium]|nr:glycosyltransferase family 39 protein [Clostridia bacterium]